jgi:hypothetical protein
VLGGLLGKGFGPTHFILNLNRALLLFGASILLWPRKYWWFGASFIPRAPQVRTPFVGPHRAPDRSWCLTVDATSTAASLGDPILVRAGDARITGIDRRYSAEDTLRLYAIVGEGPEPPRVTLDLIDSSGCVRRSASPVLAPAQIVSSGVPARKPRVAIAQIDEEVSLQGLSPGIYALRLTAAADAEHSEKYAEFRIVER